MSSARIARHEQLARTTRSSRISSATAEQLSRGADQRDAGARRAQRRGARARGIAALRGARSPRCADRSRSSAAAAGNSACSRTPTTTSSPRHRCRSACTFDEVVVAQELGSYKPAHRHWEEFFAAPVRRATACPCRRVAVPRRRPVQRARSAKRLDQSSRRGRPRRRSDARARRPHRHCRTRSMSSSPHSDQERER